MPLANEVHAAALRAAPFFLRNGLKSDDIEACWRVVRDRYTTDRDIDIVPVEEQGGCSYTCLVLRGGEDVVVQVRLGEHAISEEIVRAVRGVFGGLVPRVLWCEEVVVGCGRRVQVCGMTRVGGRRFCEVQPRRWRLCTVECEGMRRLVLDVAGFFAMSWRSAKRGSVLDGKVGSSIRERLVKLQTDLPTSWLRSRARAARRAFDSGMLNDLPICLNHGDLLPSNIMVDDQNWRLAGVVDWAEAEYLPFGMTLYGLEHLLGFLDNQGRFVYYKQANELRNAFWQRLRIHVPEVANREIWRAIVLSREIGILLWHGIAWDNGRLDRVVDYENDGEELAHLEASLEGSGRSRDSKL